MEFADVVDRVHKSITELTSGNPEPYIECWSHAEDITLFRAGGSNPRGWPDVTEPLRRIARHFAGHAGHTCDEESIYVGSDLAVAVGFQRGEPSGAALPSDQALLRVTHVFRREGDAWKIIHRHADSQRAAEAIRPREDPP
jgi:ketosteroid isomerase-like protein